MAGKNVTYLLDDKLNPRLVKIIKFAFNFDWRVKFDPFSYQDYV